MTHRITYTYELTELNAAKLIRDMRDDLKQCEDVHNHDCSDDSTLNITMSCDEENNTVTIVERYDKDQGAFTMSCNTDYYYDEIESLTSIGNVEDGSSVEVKL